MFSEKYKIVVKDFLKKDFAHTPEDADAIIKQIIQNHNEKNVIIDFSGIKTANTAFCNVLYEGLKIEGRTWSATLINCNDLILQTFNRVKNNYNKKDLEDDL